MDITDQMLKRAVVKGVEAGLLPRRALREEFDDAQNLMRAILHSALNGAGLSDEQDLLQQTSTSDAAFPQPAKRFVPAELHNVY